MRKTTKQVHVAAAVSGQGAELTVEIGKESHHVALTIDGRLVQREACNADGTGLIVQSDAAVETLLSDVGRLVLGNLDSIAQAGGECSVRLRLYDLKPFPSLEAQVQASVDGILSASRTPSAAGASLDAMVAKGRGPDAVREELAAWRCAAGVIEQGQRAMLPSEEELWRGMNEEARNQLQSLQAEGRFLGTLDLASLLKQMRPGPAPRWFLYPPMSPCDAVEWNDEANIRLRFLRGTREVGVLFLKTPNLFHRQGSWRARTILLPAEIRERVRALAREKLETFVLYEPAKVTHERFRPPKVEKPDPALLVRVGRKWFVDRIWEDPAVEDPRALNTLREFYVGPPMTPPW